MSQIARIGLGLILAAVLMAETFLPLMHHLNDLPALAWTMAVQTLSPTATDVMGAKAFIAAMVIMLYLGAGLLAAEIVCAVGRYLFFSGTSVAVYRRIS